MDLITISIGGVMIFYGIYTLRTRTKAPEKFGKLKAMKERFGDDTGLALHITAYSIVPIVVGVLVSFAGLNGLSLLQIF
jgi:hypothetical protein